MKFTLTFLSCFFCLAMFAQHEISGTLIDRTGDPIIGGNVFIPTTYEGANSDIDGKFSFTTNESEALLMIQMIGYASDSIQLQLPLTAPLTIKLKESINKLAQVVVTAGAMEASDARKTAVLSSVDVVTTGATGDLVEALSVLPGSTPAGETGQLLVRGGAASETQAFINGMRVPKFYTSTIPDVASRSRFNPFDFKGITFATGGFSAEYGDALSAALILQSQNLPDQNRWSVGLMSLGGSVGHTKVWDKQAFSLVGNYVHLGLYKQLNKDAKEQFIKTPQNGGLQAGYWWENKTGGLLRVYAQSSINMYKGDHSDEANIYGGNVLGLENQNLYAQAVYQQPDGENGLWQIGAAFAIDEDQLGLDDFTRILLQRNFQLRAKRSGNLGEIAKWTAGGSYQNQYEQVNLGVAAIEEVGNLERQSGAAFLEMDWFLNKKWVARTGLRYDQFKNSPAQFSPRFQLSHIFSPNHQLALSAGRYVQRDIPQLAFTEALNFEPARADHLMLTYFRNWNKRVLRTELYYKNYQQLVSSVGDGYAPSGEGFARGIDLFYRDRKSFKNGDLWLSLSYIDSQRKWRETPELAPVPFAAEQVASVVYKHFFPKPSLGVAFTYRWHNGRPYQNPNIPGYFQDKSPHYHDLSMNISYLTNIGGNFTVIFASMTNVAGFDQIHTYRYGNERDMSGSFPRTEVRSLFPSFPFIGAFMNINERKENISVDDL